MRRLRLKRPFADAPRVFVLNVRNREANPAAGGQLQSLDDGSEIYAYRTVDSAKLRGWCLQVNRNSSNAASNMHKRPSPASRGPLPPALLFVAIVLMIASSHVLVPVVRTVHIPLAVGRRRAYCRWIGAERLGRPAIQECRHRCQTFRDVGFAGTAGSVPIFAKSDVPGDGDRPSGYRDRFRAAPRLG